MILFRYAALSCVLNCASLLELSRHKSGLGDVKSPVGTALNGNQNDEEKV